VAAGAADPLRTKAPAAGRACLLRMFPKRFFRKPRGPVIDAVPFALAIQEQGRAYGVDRASNGFDQDRKALVDQ
jgi:hypothetical protein